MRSVRAVVSLIRGAKRIEWIALVAALAVLCLLAVNGFMRDAPESNQSALETRVAQALACVNGAGHVRVLIGEGDDAGVLVVAEGADDIRVALELARAVSTLLGVSNERIEVLKMDGGG